MWLFFILYAVLSQAPSNGPTALDNDAPKYSESLIVLQKLVYGEGSGAMSVRLSHRRINTSSGDFTQFRFEQIRLAVVDRKLGRANFSTLFEIDVPGFTTGSLSGSPPLSDQGFIATKPLCLFPTARLIESSEGCYLILFDGKKGRLLLSKNIGKNEPNHRRFSKFENVEAFSPKEKQLLSSLFSSSFDPTDVYWDYFLVVNSAFFGHRCETDGLEGNVNTETLFERWQLAKKRLVDN